MIGDYAMMQLSGALASGDLWVRAGALAVYAALVVLLIVAFDYLFVWMERKAVARVQARRGPTRTGGYGLLQNLADVVKLLSKENPVPKGAQKGLFLVTIPLMLAVAIFLVMLIPLTPGLVASDLGLGALVIFVVLSFAPLLVFLSGTSSGNKFAAIGAQRSLIALLGYEVPLLLVVASVGMLANGYGFPGIVAAQSGGVYVVGIVAAQVKGVWFAVLMPIGCLVFFVAMLAELGRPPFDLGDAGSEISGGWLADVGAPYFALSAFLDSTRMFLGCLLMAMLFFGGWSGPAVLPPVAWLLIKSFAIGLVIALVRATLPRMRLDQMLKFCWTVLVPFAILNLIVTVMIFIV